ncbi:MAG: hypothetical protein GF315_09745, partial [candidate division Zixibacteria bacterium]|nr:hypothetical protein [candidate division Zixibacteria bacterium]
MNKSRVIILKSKQLLGAPLESHLPHVRDLLSEGLKQLTNEKSASIALTKVVP